MNLNKVFLIGRLTRDPEIRTTQAGQTVAQIGLATNRVWYNDQRQKQEVTDFHNVVAWARLAEVVNQYTKKGSLIMVEGRIQTRSWQATDGTTKYRTEVVAENIQLGPRASNPGGSSYAQSSPASAPIIDNQMPSREPEIPVEKIETINLDEFGNPIEETPLVNVPGEPMPF